MERNDHLISFQLFRLQRFFYTIFIITSFLSSLSFSQRSKIVGTVKDANSGEALFGANVVVLNTTLGGATDADGEFYIINVPVGTYQVQASMVGYAKKVVVNVLVSADRTTTLDFELTSEAIESEEIIITAQRNVLHKEVSNTQLVVTNEQIVNSAGIRDINTFLEKQPGISSTNGYLEIRGGAADQTGTFINGMSYNNAAVGNAETSIPLSAIDQVSLVSGGFNPEYGNFRSGLINVTTKSGTKDGYHGTITVSRNIAHLKRFGPLLSDPLGPALAPYLDPRIAFTGNSGFSGWNSITEQFNQGRLPGQHAAPLDYYLLTAWMHMAVPDYKGLEELGYTVPEGQKRLFEEHARKEEGIDYNIDGGFGGPIPFISEELGDATFFISHNFKEEHYVAPVSRESQKLYNTMASIKMNPAQSITVTLNGLWKRQLGVSPLKPAFGDTPDSKKQGGFMPINNLKFFTRLIQSYDTETDYMFDPPIFPLLDETTLMGGININHVINNSTFWEFTGSYMSIKDHSPTGDNRNNQILTLFGPFPVSEMPYGKLQFAPNNRLTYISGTDTISYAYPNYDVLPEINRRFRGKEGDLYTNVHIQQARLKFDIVSQISKHHYFKSGLEYNNIDINHKMWLKWNRTGPYNSYEYNYHRIPSQTGFYLQDQVSYLNIVANLGFRLDYFYGGGGKWPTGDLFSEAFSSTFGGAPRNAGDAADSFYAALASGRSLIWEKWEEYDKTHPGFLQPIKNHLTFSPRLGIAFPVTENSKFYFNYGHFRSNPPYYSMYLYRYRYDKNGLYEMSDPNLEPPKTVSYEIGVAYNFYENMILKLSGYYKDVTGETESVNYVNSSGTINYDRWANNNYEDIRGFEVNITKNDLDWISGWINFNYMLKKSGLTGRATISNITIDEERANLFEGEERRYLPQPKFNANITFRSPETSFNAEWMNKIMSDWRFTFLTEWKAGEYFTFNRLGKLYYSNNLQWPDYFMVDLRVSKSVDLLGLNTTFFLDVNNLFNFKVNLVGYGFPFGLSAADTEFGEGEGGDSGSLDLINYLASLRLPMYNSPEYDGLRSQNPGYYLPGDDEVGEMQSSDKPYIDNPNYTYFLYGQPRDIWFGIKVDF